MKYTNDYETNPEFLAQKAKADRGFTNECRAVAVRYSLGKKHDMAVFYYTKGMEFGDLNSQYGLATDLLFRNEVIDIPRGYQLLVDAAEKGHLEAIAKLGEEKIAGREIPRDIPQAFKLFEKFHEEVVRVEAIGSLNSMLSIPSPSLNYPICLALGLGCKRDGQKAYQILDMLAKKGFSSAEDLLVTGVIPVNLEAIVYTRLKHGDFDGGAPRGVEVDVNQMFRDSLREFVAAEYKK